MLKNDLLMVSLPIRIAGLLMAVLVLLNGCDSSEPEKVVDFNQVISNDLQTVARPENADGRARFNFGFDIRSSVEEDLRQYQPLITYLSGATGYRFKLVIASQGSLLDEMLGHGEVQFAAIGAVTHIKTQEKYGAIPLVRGINSAGKAEYRSAIVTLPDSAVQNIYDLHNQRLAFGSRNSTQGYLIPRIILETQGIGLNDLKEFQFTGSHRNCADSVISGRFEACGMQDTMAEGLQADGLLRIMYYSDYYPSSGISASPNVAPEVIEKVRQALINFEPKGRHAGMLYNWDRTEMPNGFTRASSDDYELLRKWMRHFGLMPESEAE